MDIEQSSTLDIIHVVVVNKVTHKHVTVSTERIDDYVITFKVYQIGFVEFVTPDDLPFNKHLR